jgi:hypothetical protein
MRQYPIAFAGGVRGKKKAAHLNAAFLKFCNPAAAYASERE